MTLIEIFREEFEKMIAQKTGWGKNEIMVVFDRASVQALIRYARQQGVVLD